MTPRRRKHDVVSLETLDLRVAALEDGMEEMRLQVSSAVSEIQASTALVEEIHGDTKGLVEFAAKADALWEMAKQRVKQFKSGSASLGKWLTAVCGGAYSVFLFGKAMGWWG